jgi:hypothetical protein
VTRVDDGGNVHACMGPTLSSRADGGALSSDPVNYIFYLKKLL